MKPGFAAAIGALGRGLAGAGRALADFFDVDKDRHDGEHGVCYACGRERWDLDGGMCPTCYGRTAP